MPLFRQCNTGRTCFPLPITTTENFPSYTRCSENHNNMFGKKSENPRFEIWYSVLEPSGGTEKNLNMDAQLQVIK